MVDRKSKKNNNSNDEAARMARWSNSAYSAANFSIMSPPPSENKKLLGFGSHKPVVMDVALQPIEHDDLKQGSLYIVKIRNVSVALFEGWDDDMCCFAVLRSDSTPMRWSEARYIPGDFDAYDAFDEAGNPPVHLWTRQLRVNVPTNWFSIFEEARRKQRDWMNEQNEEEYYYPPGEQTPAAPPARHQAVNPATITPPATEKSADDKTAGASSHNNDLDSEQALSSTDEQPEDEEIASATGSAQPEVNGGSVKSDSENGNIAAAPNSNGHQHNGATNGDAKLPATNGSSPAAAPMQPQSQQQTRTVIKEYEPNPNTKYEPTPNTSTNTNNATKQHLATPPASPHASEQVRKYQASSEKSRILSTSDFAFPHNGDQFSIGTDVTPPPVPQLPTNGNAKKISSGSNGTATPPKSKRRSVQDLFRGGK
ncbi:hypothetical protein BDB00DRAFT_796028 [Zychaea mexicana]|uniref:uncharacterized protein n=1 Tax=Zychaea mexicana TaxID=64656 RepID=UPI0022FE3EF0|nr:uncharacterized protein BDB00DRAFT_796028 [Zychaea mexicana]KAI9499251.1 hypothetical protein BDB00DRAFT_796028 [Zychaea mexicana]